MGIVTYNYAVRACIDDVTKIKIGKNQNQNWALIGRGSKTFWLRQFNFWKSLANQRSPQGLILYKMKNQNRRCPPDRRLSECYTPEARAHQQHVDRLHRHTIHTAQQFTAAARRQTAPPHHTHNFCWHGPRQRSHGEGEPLPLPGGGGDRSNEWLKEKSERT